MIPRLFIADLGRALNGEPDAAVNVLGIDYGAFMRSIAVVKAGRLQSMVENEPGLSIVFEKEGRKYVAQLSLYASWEVLP